MAPAVDARRTEGPSLAGTAPDCVSRAVSVSLTPPSGPTISTTSPTHWGGLAPGPGLAPGLAPALAWRGHNVDKPAFGTGIEQQRQPGLAHERGHFDQPGLVGHLRKPGPTRLLGRLARRRPQPGQRLIGPIGSPPGHAPLRRPRHDHVDPDLGHQLGGQLAAVALQDRLHDHDPAARRGYQAAWPGPQAPAHPSAPRPPRSERAGHRRR